MSETPNSSSAPRSTARSGAQKTARELVAFTVVGGVQYVLDVALFTAILYFSGLAIFGNIISRACGAIVGFYLNGVFTFGVVGARRERFHLRFIAAWLMMTAVSTLAMYGLSQLATVRTNPWLIAATKGAVELVLFFCGFALCKFWVFVPREPAAAATRPATRAARGITLFILPHPDDEFFFAPRIRELTERGKPLRLIYTTDGAAYGLAPQIRRNETLAALRRLGVDVDNDVLFPGIEQSVPDGQSHLSTELVYRQVADAIDGLDIREIYVPAWEGGHVDHDVCHLVGVALARQRGISDVFECPFYNARSAFPPFRVMTWRPGASNVDSLPLSIGQGLFFLSLAGCFPSQWRTFLGLGPEAGLRLVLQRRHERRRATGINYLDRPHARPLLYEKRFGVPHRAFVDATRAFICDRLMGEHASRLTPSAETAH